MFFISEKSCVRTLRLGEKHHFKTVQYSTLTVSFENEEKLTKHFTAKRKKV